MDAGLSQLELADRVGTSHSQISRIESGRHRTNLETLQRIAAALARTLVVGFETPGEDGRPQRDIVSLGRGYTAICTSPVIDSTAASRSAIASASSASA